MIALLRAIAGRRELLQLRRQRQRWEADYDAAVCEADTLAMDCEDLRKEVAKMPQMEAEIATLAYQRTLMIETLRLVNCAKGCKCKIHVQRLFDRLRIR